MKTHKIKSAIREAFEHINVKPSAFTEEGARIGSIIHTANNRGTGVINRPDWNAGLSFRTAKLLNAPTFDVNNHRGHRNAFDVMCGVEG
jgi:hypothetical protein